MNVTTLKPDGERFLTEFRGIIELEHYHRYFIAETLVHSKDVLDIASGEGFGSEILSRSAKSVIGVDISADAVSHASSKYKRANLSFRHGSATEIPLQDNSVDVIVSFETIEHLAEHDAMMAELCRVLRPDGYVILSSPNKLEYSDKPGYVNAFHVKELYTADFLRLTSRYFKNVQHYGQRVMTASVIASENLDGRFITFAPSHATQGVPEQMYDIVLASNVELPVIPASAFEQPHGPLQPQKLNALVDENSALKVENSAVKDENSAVKRALETASTALAALERVHAKEVQGSKQNAAQLALHQAALDAALADMRLLLGDKWWKRTKSLRHLSNKIRKLKGKQPKALPASPDLQHYLSIADGRTRDVTPKTDIAGIPRVPYSAVREDFVTYEAGEPLTTNPKAIAFYLPQFHPFPENDAWWGKGFTEWTNVGKALPMFAGHHQPHCPIHFGYYDLRVAEVMEEQAKLAREYGISGFAYYFYWFAGKVLMDRPLQQMLGNPKVDIPFCMIWANENWTRRWDGQENDVLISQKHSLDDSRAMLDYLRPFIEDPRYIKIDGKPLFVIYRADIIPDMAETISAWRDQAAGFGFPGIYVVCAQTFGQRDPRKYGFDAAMEFPPHTIVSDEISQTISHVETNFDGLIYSYDQAATNAVKRGSDDYKVFPTAMLSWDNTARKKTKSSIFAEFSLVRYSQWLSSNAERVAKNPLLGSDERLMFINAWNEWAEGSHLEPDQKHGYGYLAATRTVLQNYAADAADGAEFIRPKFPEVTGSDVAVIVHLHYEDTWQDLLAGIKRLASHSPDVFVTVTSLRLARMVRADLPEAIVEIVDNRGRDIRPFVLTLAQISHLPYKAVAKVHGKASLYRNDGDKLRQSALDALLSDEAAQQMLGESTLGLLAPDGAVLEHNNINMTYSGNETAFIANELGLTDWFGHFPAGSMFWFRPQALQLLLSVKPESFDVERGLADGTRAHAIERLFCAICENAGYSVGTTEKGARAKILQAPKSPTKVPVQLEQTSGIPLEDWHARILRHADGALDRALPALPPRAIQEQFVGSAMRPAFEEAYKFYTTFRNYSKALAMPMEATDARFLDFGCGWGRFLRYAMNDFSRDRLIATDIDPDIIKVCLDSGIPATFHQIDPRGALPFADNTFSHAMAYSVFTHLPEEVHLNWSAEIVRVLKPGGVFCGTIETRKFLEYIQNIPDGDAYPNDWVRALATYKPQIKDLLRQYDENSFVYLPTGGGGVRTSDVYGDAVVSPNFIETHWQGAKVRAVIDENFWQTVFIVQKL